MIADRPSAAPPLHAPDTDPATILEDLAAGRIRAAEPDDTVPGGWRVRPEVKAAILACFADPSPAVWQVGPFAFRDRAAFVPIDPGPGR